MSDREQELAQACVKTLCPETWATRFDQIEHIEALFREHRREVMECCAKIIEEEAEFAATEVKDIVSYFKNGVASLIRKQGRKV